MTIVELRDRLTQIIEDNEKRGWAERNTSEVVASVQKSPRRVEYRGIQYALGSWLGIETPNQVRVNVFELKTVEGPTYKN